MKRRRFISSLSSDMGIKLLIQKPCKMWGFPPLYHSSHFYFPFCGKRFVGQLPLLVLSSDSSTKFSILTVSSHPYTTLHMKNSEVSSLSTLFQSLTAQGAPFQDTGYTEVLLSSSLNPRRFFFLKLIDIHHLSETVFWLAPI